MLETPGARPDRVVGEETSVADSSGELSGKPGGARFTGNRSPISRRWWLRIYAALWLGAGAYLMCIGTDYLRTPTGDDWTPAITFLRLNERPGEVVIFDPAWVFGYATDLNKFQGLSPVKDARAVLQNPSCRGVWVVSPFRPPDVPDGIEDRFPTAQPLRAGRFHLTYVSAAPRPMRHLGYLELESAHTEVAFAGRNVRGEWDGSGHVYKGIPALHADYLRVHTRSEQFTGATHTGILLHPAPEGWHSLEFSGVTLGSRLSIEGGLPDPVIQPGRSELELTVFVGGDQAASIRFPNERGWKLHSVDTKRWQGTTQPLRFAVRALNGNHSRHFLFTFDPGEQTVPAPLGAGCGSSDCR